MPYCPNCGVELDADRNSCPLCGHSIFQQAHLGTERIIDPEGKAMLNSEERSLIVWEIITVSVAISAIMTCSIDLLMAGRLTWSLYPLASILLVWLLGTAVLRLKGWPRFTVAALALPAYLVCLDLIQDGLDWSLRIALPITLVVDLTALAFGLVQMKARRRGLNLFAILLVGATALCITLEACLDFEAEGMVSLHWSEIVAAATLPIALFLFYLHFRIARNANVRRFFRL